MSTVVDELLFRLEADSRELRSELRKAGLDVDRFTDRGTRSLSGFERGLKTAGRAAVALGVALAGREFVQASDTYQLMTARLKLVTRSTEELTRVTNALFQSSQNTRQSFAATADLYARIGRSSKTLGKTQEELLQVTENIQKAIVVSGASATEASAGLIQFSQGLASGALRGDELRSVLEQLPRLAQAIADGMGITVGQLRDLGAEGALSGKAVVDALLSQTSTLENEFREIPRTVGGALQQIQNELLKVSGEIAQSTDSTRALNEALDEMREIIASDGFKEGLTFIVTGMANIASGAASAIEAVGDLLGQFEKITGFSVSDVFGAEAARTAESVKREMDFFTGQAEAFRFLGTQAGSRGDIAGFHENLRKQREALEQAQALREELYKLADAEEEVADQTAEITTEVVQLTAEQKQAQKAHQKLTKAIQEEIDGNEELIAALRTSEREYSIVEKKLEILSKGFAGTDEEARRLAETLVSQQEVLQGIRDDYQAVADAAEDAARHAQRAQEEAARETQRVWDNAADGIQDAFADALFQGENLFDGLKSAARRTAAEVASAMIFRPIISPIIQGAQGAFGIGGGTAGGLSVPGIGGGQIGGGSGFGLASSQAAGLGGFQSALAAVPIWGWIALAASTVKGFVEGAPRNSAKGAIDTLLLPSHEQWLADPLRSFANASDPIGTVLTDFGLPQWISPLGFLGNKRPSEGETLEASFGGVGNITAVGVDNGGNRSSAQSMADSFSQVLAEISSITGGSFSGGAYISNSSRSGLRLNENGEWLNFGNEADLIDYLIDARLVGGDERLRTAAKLSSVDTVEGLFSDLAAAQQIKAIIDAANDNSSPLEKAIKALNDEFSTLIAKSNELGQNTSALIRIRDQEIQKTREASKLQERLQAQNRIAIELGLENDILTAFGGAAAQIQSFSTAYNLSAGSSLSPINRIALAQSEFDKLAESVGAGNIGAVGAFTQSAQTLLSLGRDAYASTGAFGSIERDVFSKLSSVQSSLVSPENISRNLTDALAALDLSDEARNDKLIQALRDEIRSLKTEVVQLRVIYEAA